MNIYHFFPQLKQDEVQLRPVQLKPEAKKLRSTF